MPTVGPTSEVRPGQNNTGRERTTRDRIPDPSRNLTPDEIRRLTPEQKRQLLEEIEAQRIDPADLPEVDNRDVINVENYSPNGIPETAFWRERDWGGFSLEAYKDRMERRFGRYYYDEDGNLNERGRAVMEVIRQRRRDQNEEVLRELMGDATPPSRRRDRRREMDEEAGRTTPEMYRDPETGNLINTETGEIVERGPERERVGETPSPQRSLRERVSAAIERAAQRLLDNETPASRRRRRGNEATRRQKLIDAIERAAQRLLQENDQSRFGRREDNRRRRRRGETDAADEDLRRRLEQDIREELGLDRERDPDAAPEDLERDKQIEEEVGRIVDAMVEPDEPAESVDKISEDFDRWNDVLDGIIQSIDESDLSTKEKNRLKNQAREAIEEIGMAWGNKDRLDQIRSRRQRTSAAKDPSLSDDGQRYSDRINRMVQGALDARERAMAVDTRRREREDRPAPPTRIPGFSAEASERKPMRDIPDWREVDDNDLDQLVADIRDADFRSMDSDMRRRAAERYRAAVREQQRRAGGRDVPEVSNQQRRFVRDRMRGMVPSRPYWRDESFTGDRDRLERQLGSLYDGDGPDARLTGAGQNLRDDMQSEKLLLAERLREARNSPDATPEVDGVGPDRTRPDGLGGEVDVPAGEIDPSVDLGEEGNLDELGQWVNSLPDDPEFEYVRREAARLDRQIRDVYDDPAALRERREQMQQLRDNYENMVSEAGDDVEERDFMNRYVTTAQAALERINRRLLQLDNSNSRDDDNPDFDPEQLRLFDKIDELIDGDVEDQDILDPIVKRTQGDGEDEQWTWTDQVQLSTGEDVPTELSPDWEERASQMPEDQQEKFRYLARFAQFGPTYKRGVAESLMTAHRFRDGDNAYYMAQAEQSAHNAITGEKSKAPDLDKPSEYTSLPWNKPVARIDADKDREQREALTDQWALKTAGDLRDAVRNGGDAKETLSRIRKLRIWGAMGDSERQAAVESQVRRIASDSPYDTDVLDAVLNLTDDDQFDRAADLLYMFTISRVDGLQRSDLYKPDLGPDPDEKEWLKEFKRLTGLEFENLDPEFLDDISREATGLTLAQRRDVAEKIRLARASNKSAKQSSSGSVSEDYPDVTVVGLADGLESLADLQETIEDLRSSGNSETVSRLELDQAIEEEAFMRSVNNLMERFLGDSAPRFMVGENYREVSERLRKLVRDDDNNTIIEDLLPEAAKTSFDEKSITERGDDELRELLTDLERYIDDENQWFGPFEGDSYSPEDWDRAARRYLRSRDLDSNIEERRRLRDSIRSELSDRDNPVDGFDGTSDELGVVGGERDQAAGVEDVGDEARRNIKDLMADAWRRRRQRMSKIDSYDPDNPPWETEEPQYTVADIQALADADPDDSRLVDGKPSPEMEAKARAFAKQAFEFSFTTDDGTRVRSEVNRAYLDRDGRLWVSGTFYANDEDGIPRQVGFFERSFMKDGTVAANQLSLDNIDLETGKGLERLEPKDTGLDYAIDVYGSKAVERRALDPDARERLDDTIRAMAAGESEPGLFLITTEEGVQTWLITPDVQKRVVDPETPTLRKSGLGTAFNLHSWNWSKKAGFTRAAASSGMEDGDYVWGRMGYRPESRDQNVLLWGEIVTQIKRYDEGKPSIIENDAQRDQLVDLASAARGEDYSPITSPSHMDAILALEAGSKDRNRSGKVKEFLRSKEAKFTKGEFVFDDRITPTPFDATSGGKTGSSPTVDGSGVTEGTRPVGTGGIETSGHVPVPRNSPEGKVIGDNDTSTPEGAANHLKAGGSIDDVPDELVPDALSSASEEDGDPYFDTGSSEYVKRSADGRLSQQGWRVVDRDSAQVRVVGDEEEQAPIEAQLTPNALVELSPGFETWMAEGEVDAELAPAVVDDPDGEISFDVIDPKRGVAAALPKGARDRVFIPAKNDTRKLLDAPLEGGDGKHYWSDSYVWIDTRKLPNVKVGYNGITEEEHNELNAAMAGSPMWDPRPYQARNADITVEGVIRQANEAQDELTVIGTAKQNKEVFVLLRDATGRIHSVNARHFDGIVRNDSSLKFYTINSKFEEGKYWQIAVRNADGEVVAGMMPVRSSTAEKAGDWIDSAQQAAGVSRETEVAARVSRRIYNAKAQGSGKNRRIPFQLENEEEISFMISELDNRVDVIEDMVADMDAREAIRYRATQRSLKQLRDRLSDELSRRRDSRSREGGTPLDQMLASQTAAMVGITNQGGFHAGNGKVVLPLPGNSFDPDLEPLESMPRFEDAIDQDETRAVVPRIAALTHRWLSGMETPDHMSFIPVWDNKQKKVVAVVPNGEVTFGSYPGDGKFPLSSDLDSPLLSNPLGDITLLDDLGRVAQTMNREDRERTRDEIVRQVREMFSRAREASAEGDERWREMITRGMPDDSEPPAGFDSMDDYVSHLLSTRQIMRDRAEMEESVIEEIVSVFGGE